MTCLSLLDLLLFSLQQTFLLLFLLVKARGIVSILPETGEILSFNSHMKGEMLQATSAQWNSLQGFKPRAQTRADSTLLHTQYKLQMVANSYYFHKIKNFYSTYEQWC